MLDVPISFKDVVYSYGKLGCSNEYSVNDVLRLKIYYKDNFLNMANILSGKC
jgi:hypothetical protein